ncbi:MAG: UbiD family decarboxylase [Candidatus Caldarchaeum sp.]|nr:UbiD family decarboxylase [Candidatus Caldarchaeum sp.]MDW7977740.1 UbiD family decarboxylase [Candidatus Caldarchaeum sp.]
MDLLLPAVPFPYEDLREFIRDAERENELQLVMGAEEELEIGVITEVMAKKTLPPVVLFDRIPGKPPGFRVVSNLFNTEKRTARVLGLDDSLTGIRMVRAWKEKLEQRPVVKPVEVSDGPVMENVLKEDEVDVSRFPAPRWSKYDGGRFIGTGCSVITKHPDEGWVNVGTYRVMVVGRDEVSINIAGGKHGDLIRKLYWERGMNCPIAISLGQEPTFFVMGGYQLTGWGESVFDAAGGIRRKPVKYIVSELTGLPIPATSEVVLEGELIPTWVKSVYDGPFGEWPGYVTPAKKCPVVKVKRIYYRDNPIIQGNPPLKPPLPEALAINVVSSAALWREVEQHVPEVKGVWCANEGGTGGVAGFWVVVSIKQRYPGHAKQAGLAAAACRAGAYAGRFVIVVDDDIDPSNLQEVVWAVATRCDPEKDIDIIRGCWDSPVDPLLDPKKAEEGDITNTRAIINACRPYHRLASFPPVATADKELVEKVLKKFPQLSGDKRMELPAHR